MKSYHFRPAIRERIAALPDGYYLRVFLLLLTLLCLIMPSSVSSAAELPLWEAGFGVTGLSLPDYRGSDEQRVYVLPLPYLVYRGRILRLDRKGLYGLLFHTKRLQLNISADAGVPVKSSRNTARAGMPNLDPTVQIGPSIEFCISPTCGNGAVVQVRLPLRAVLVSDFTYINEIGFVVNPNLNFDFENIGNSGWNFGFAAGPLYATKKFHRYYYEVSPVYAIPGQRPAYDARGGYSGSLLIATASRRFGRIWFGAFARYDDLSNSVFADSPLVKTRHSFMAGFGIAWVFGESRMLVSETP